MNSKINTSKMITAAALFALCPLALHAQTPPLTVLSSPVTLRYQFKPGMSRSYIVVMDVNGTVLTGQSGAGMPVNQHLEMTLRQTVQDVRASDGAATIVTGIDAMKLRMNSQDTSMPQSKLDQLKAMTTTVITPAGKTLSTVLSPLLGQVFGGGMTGNAFNPTGLVETAFALPSMPVAVGDTWRGDESAATAAVAPTSTYSLKSLKLSGGIPTAYIERTLDGNLNTMVTKAPISMKIMSRTTGTGETEFDVQNGTVIDQQTTGNSITTVIAKNPQDGSPISYKMQLQTKVDVSQIFTVSVPNPAPTAAPAH